MDLSLQFVTKGQSLLENTRDVQIESPDAWDYSKVAVS